MRVACAWTAPQFRVASPLQGCGGLVRPWRALRHPACAHPVVASEQRVPRDGARSQQIRLEEQTPRLAAEQHALSGPGVLRGLAPARAALAGLLCVHLHSSAAARAPGRGGDLPCRSATAQAEACRVVRRAGWPWPACPADACGAHGGGPPCPQGTGRTARVSLSSHTSSFIARHCPQVALDGLPANRLLRRQSRRPRQLPAPHARPWRGK